MPGSIRCREERPSTIKAQVSEGPAAAEGESRSRRQGEEFVTDTPLEGIRACVFDAYGTLFDYASAAARCKDEVGDKFAQLTTQWR